MSAEMWKLGYVTTGDEGPAPVGTWVCFEDRVNKVSEHGTEFRPGCVVTREAPEAKWRRVVVWVRGEGKNAQMQFTGKDHNGISGVLAIESLTHATSAPDRKKVEELAWKISDASRRCVGTAHAVIDLVDYVCGKEGDA